MTEDAPWSAEAIFRLVGTFHGVQGVATDGRSVDSARRAVRGVHDRNRRGPFTPRGAPVVRSPQPGLSLARALDVLASLTVDGPIPAETYYTAAIGALWRFGELLLDIEQRNGSKVTALFPTNPEKRKTAEMAFRAFAIGDYRRTADDLFTTNGPLFEWRAVGLSIGEGDEPLIGITDVGWSLLNAVGGISVEEPHPAPAAVDFLEHLCLHSPFDHVGYMEIIRAIGIDGATRQEVLDHTAKVWPDWTENEISTNAAGYTARAREWGLVEPKQVKGKYHLTAFEIEQAKGSK